MTAHRARALWLLVFAAAAVSALTTAAAELLTRHWLYAGLFALIAWLALSVSLVPGIAARLGAEDQAGELELEPLPNPERYSARHEAVWPLQRQPDRPTGIRPIDPLTGWQNGEDVR